MIVKGRGTRVTLAADGRQDVTAMETSQAEVSNEKQQFCGGDKA